MARKRRDPEPLDTPEVDPANEKQLNKWFRRLHATRFARRVPHLNGCVSRGGLAMSDETKSSITSPLSVKAGRMRKTMQSLFAPRWIVHRGG